MKSSIGKTAHIFSLLILITFISQCSHSGLIVDRVPETRVRLAEVAKQLNMFYADCGRYPSSTEGLRALVQKPENCPNWGPNPYAQELPLDPWRHEFLYQLINKDKFELKSLGADGKSGGEAVNRDWVYEE